MTVSQIGPPYSWSVLRQTATTNANGAGGVLRQTSRGEQLAAGRTAVRGFRLSFRAPKEALRDGA